MAVAVAGNSLILDGGDCMHLAAPLARYLAEQARRDGGVPPRLRELAENIMITARAYRDEALNGSDTGTAGFRDGVTSGLCATSAAWLTVEATAELLSCSPEYVRRLCRQRALYSVRAADKGAWMVDETAVLERLGERLTKAA